MLDRCHQIESRGPGVSGLDAVHAGDPANKPVVVAVTPPFVGEARRLEIVEILGVMVPQGPAQQRHVPSGGSLLLVRESGSVTERRFRHSQAAGLLGHAGGELAFGSGDVLGNRRGDIVGGFGHQRQNGVLDLDRLPLFKAQFGRRLSGRARRKADVGVEAELAAVDRLKQHVKRHHFGQ